jgi:NitT/TauT family transport system substrate-binding protein
MSRRIGTAIALGLVLAASLARADEPTTLRIGWITVPISLAPIMSAKQDVTRHLGKTYTIEPIHFAGTSPMIAALASGDLDIAELSYSSFGLAIQNGHMTDLRMIADSLQDGVNAYSGPFVVRKDGPIKTIEDLKGKTVCVNVIGAGIDIGMRAMLRRHGLEAGRDYNVIEADFAHQTALLAEGKTDMTTTVSESVNDEELQRIARPLFDLKEAMGGPTQILARAARAGFLAKSRSAAVDYFEDEIREWHWYLDPKNRDAALAIVSDFNKKPAASYAKWIWTNDKDLYHDPDDRLNLDALQRNLKTQKEAGFLAIDIDAAQYSDLTIVADAAKRVHENP